jgi:hypothetical protein
LGRDGDTYAIQPGNFTNFSDFGICFAAFAFVGRLVLGAHCGV